MTAFEDYVAVLLVIIVTSAIGGKSSDIEAVVEDNNAKSILPTVRSDLTCFCDGSLSDKMLLDLWKVCIGYPSFWNETPSSHFRYSQCQRVPSFPTKSLLDYAEDTIARLGITKITIVEVDERIELGAVSLSNIQS